MRIMLVSDAGEVLDSTEITREEWDNMSPTGAYLMLCNLNPGTEEA